MADESLTLEETAAIAEAVSVHFGRDQERRRRRARDRAAWRAYARAALPPLLAGAPLERACDAAAAVADALLARERERFVRQD